MLRKPHHQVSNIDVSDGILHYRTDYLEFLYCCKLLTAKHSPQVTSLYQNPPATKTKNTKTAGGSEHVTDKRLRQQERQRVGTDKGKTRQQSNYEMEPEYC